MKKSTKRAASFMLAAGMSFTTVFANTSFVSPANSSLARLIDTLSSGSGADAGTSGSGADVGTTESAVVPAEDIINNKQEEISVPGGSLSEDKSYVIVPAAKITISIDVTINELKKGDACTISKDSAAIKYVAKVAGKLVLKLKNLGLTSLDTEAKGYVVIEQGDNDTEGKFVKFVDENATEIDVDAEAGKTYYIAGYNAPINVTEVEVPVEKEEQDENKVVYSLETVANDENSALTYLDGKAGAVARLTTIKTDTVPFIQGVENPQGLNAAGESKSPSTVKAVGEEFTYNFGAAVKYVAKDNGKLALKFKTASKPYVVIEQKDNKGTAIQIGTAIPGTIEFDVKAGYEYYVVAGGSKVSLVAGSTFEKATTPSGGDDDTTTTETTTETTTTEAPTEVSTEDTGKYDPNSKDIQVYASVNGKTGQVYANAGDEVTVDFKLENVQPFDALQLDLEFNKDVLQVVKFEKPSDAPADMNIPVGPLNNALDTQNANGVIKIPFTISMDTTNPAITSNGTLIRIVFKVVEGADNVNAAVKVASSSSMTMENAKLTPNFAGINITVAKEPNSGDETSTETTTETSTETTTEDKTETTTKRRTSGGGGGGHSSSNAAKKNNSSATTTVVKGQTGSTNTTTGTTGSKNNATKTSVGEFKTPSGIVINPPALKGADGNIVAGSKLNSSSLVAGSGFGDISGRAWAVAAINKLASLGIINGVGNNNFAPDATSKRGDFMVMLTKVLGITGTPKSSFADVESGKYYANAINLAHDLGLANGVGDNKFNPEAPISRQDMMVLVANTLKALGTDITADLSVLNKYTDASSIPTYAQPSVAYLISAGFVNGTSATTIAGNENMTRAQMAVLMSKLYDSVADTAAEAVSAEEAAAEIEAAEAKEAEETAVDTEEVSAEEKDVTTSEETEEAETTK